MLMHFNVGVLTVLNSDVDIVQVEGPLNKGVVSMHMIKRSSDSEFTYKYLSLDVKGHQRVYLENADATSDSPAKSKTKLFGVSWRQGIRETVLGQVVTAIISCRLSPTKGLLIKRQLGPHSQRLVVSNQWQYCQTGVYGKGCRSTDMWRMERYLDSRYLALQELARSS